MAVEDTFQQKLTFAQNIHGLRPRAFICFSVFGTRDEALALVFDILLHILENLAL